TRHTTRMTSATAPELIQYLLSPPRASVGRRPSVGSTVPDPTRQRLLSGSSHSLSVALLTWKFIDAKRLDSVLAKVCWVKGETMISPPLPARVSAPTVEIACPERMTKSSTYRRWRRAGPAPSSSARDQDEADAGSVGHSLEGRARTP